MGQIANSCNCPKPSPAAVALSHTIITKLVIPLKPSRQASGGWFGLVSMQRIALKPNPNTTPASFPNIAPSFAMVSHTKGMLPASHASCRQQSPSHPTDKVADQCKRRAPNHRPFQGVPVFACSRIQILPWSLKQVMQIKMTPQARAKAGCVSPAEGICPRIPCAINVL